MQVIGADLGIGLDGDGDRVAVMDATGHLWAGDELLLLFAQDLLKKRPGSKIVSEVKASQNFWNFISLWGGEPVMGRTGHSLIKKVMADLQAPLGGEMSGHFFFADRYYGYDDGLYGAIRLLSLLSQAPFTLDQWHKTLPTLYSSPELRLVCQEKFRILEQVKETLSKKQITFLDIDGVRVTTPYGWWLLRVANTQEALSIRYESSTLEGFHQLFQDLQDLLCSFGIVLKEV
jgi:phosphomannomutase